MARKIPEKEYLDTAKQLRSYIPSLKKYTRRKTLSRWEKAAITRAEKRINKIGGTHRYVPLSKSQIKRLADKEAVITQGGFSMVRARNVQPDARAGVRGGKLYIKSAGREIIYDPVDPDLLSFIDHARDLFSRYQNITIWVWTNKGRASAGYRFLDKLVQDLRAKYFGAYKDLPEWLYGLAWYVQT